MIKLEWYNLPEDEPYGGAHRAAHRDFSAEVKWHNDGMDWEWTLRRQEGIIMRGRAATIDAAKQAAAAAGEKLLDRLPEQKKQEAARRAGFLYAGRNLESPIPEGEKRTG